MLGLMREEVKGKGKWRWIAARLIEPSRGVYESEITKRGLLC